MLRTALVMGLCACRPTVTPPPDTPPGPLAAPATPARDAGIVSVSGGDEPAPLHDESDASVPRPTATVALVLMRSRFRTCYNHALASDPTIHGAAVFDVTIGADGAVTSVVTKQNTLPFDLSICLERTLRSLLVEPPDIPPLKLSVPLRFVPPATP